MGRDPSGRRSSFWKICGVAKDFDPAEFDKCKQVSRLGGVSPPILICAVWEAPQEGSIKINVDASFVVGEDFASVGVVARDHAGAVLLSS